MNRAAPATLTLASAIADMLKASGVKRIFGIPGGGSSLALMEAAGDAGIEFILTRTETAAAMMAAVTGELTGTPGVVLTGIGPGATSAVNGIAYASLEKSPVILLTDGPASSPHQAVDQNALYAPITKMQGRLRPEDGTDLFVRAIETALRPPWGPVQFDLTSADAKTPIPEARYKPLNTIKYIAMETLEKQNACYQPAANPSYWPDLKRGMARHPMPCTSSPISLPALCW